MVILSCMNTASDFQAIIFDISQGFHCWNFRSWVLSSPLTTKLVNGSQVGQVGPVDSGGQFEDLDPSLVNSRNLSQVGQVRPVDSCGRVRNIDPSGSKWQAYSKCQASANPSSLGLLALVGVLAAGDVDRHVALGRVGVEDEALRAAGLVGRHAVLQGHNSIDKIWLEFWL